MSKHEDIIQHIENVKVGEKISVRTIAVALGVSEGTAYRAIKDCEALGLVSTIPRVGTVRIEKISKKNIDMLTYAEVVNVVGGSILGGKNGIYKTLHKFLIGAMEVDAMDKYIKPGCLLIVGNRDEVQKLALNGECGVLVTGGLNCTDEVKKLADEKNLPLISSNYDTFTIATLINKAISDKLIKKDIILVEDIMETEITDDVRATAYEMIQKKHVEVTEKTTVAYAAHIMALEDVDMCPVICGKKFIGVITKNEVIRALNYVSKKEHGAETYEELFIKNFNVEVSMDDGETHFLGTITPQMVDVTGTASWSALNMLMSSMGLLVLRDSCTNITADSISTYYIKPIQVETTVNVFCKKLDAGKTFSKVEVNMYDKNKELVAKTIISAKIFR